MPERAPASLKSSSLQTCILFAAACLVSAASLPAREARPSDPRLNERKLLLSNDFFGMDTGTKDTSHQTAREQVQMIKELGFAGMACKDLRGSTRCCRSWTRPG